MAAASGASSISVTVRVRPFTIREAAQLARCDDQPLFLGDGSMAAAPTPKLHNKGLRSVIKIIDDKCLYDFFSPFRFLDLKLTRIVGFSTLQRTIQSRNSRETLYRRGNGSRIRRLLLTAFSTKIHPKPTFTKRLRGVCWIAYWRDTMLLYSPMEPRDVARLIQSRTLLQKP